MYYAVALALFLLSCSNSPVSSDINRPLAAAEIAQPRQFEQVRAVVDQFADANHFAVQPVFNRDDDPMTFSIRLFRDDLTMLVSQVHGESIQVAAYPLCACELGKRIGLQSAATAATADLRARLSELR
jgi:hypothetical protein